MSNAGNTGNRPIEPRRRRNAFTLAELLVTLTLTALLAVSIVSATRALAGTRTNVERRLARSATARQALETIVAALRNVRRDPDTERPAIVGRTKDSGAGNDRIDLQIIGDTRARPDSPESDQYDVGFYLSKREGDRLPVLICRRNNGASEHPGSGGIATVVAEGIVSLSFQYYADDQWQDEWSETEPGIPEAVRVTVAALGIQPESSSKPSSPVVLSTVVPVQTNPPVERPQPQQPAPGGSQGSGSPQGGGSPQGPGRPQEGGR